MTRVAAAAGDNEAEPNDPLADPAVHEALLGMARLRIPFRRQRAIPPEDLVQDTLVWAYAARAQFRGKTRGQLWGWLSVILLNRLADRLAEFGKVDRRIVSIDDLADRSDALLNIIGRAAPTSPSSNLRIEERRLILMRAIGRLKTEHATVVKLRYFEAMPIKAIAALVGTSVPAVSMRLTRALKNLRDDPQDHLDSL